MTDERTILRVLSLGAGVQSSVALLMNCHGELPKLDAAIFADTMWEPIEVYRHLAWLRVEASRYGIPVYRVSAGNVKTGAIRQIEGGGRFVTLPFFVRNPDGSRGMGRRQCTTEFKIRPIHRFIKRGLLGLQPRKHVPKNIHIEHWFGISADETRRMRQSPERWNTNCYPLVGLPYGVDTPMRREHCIEWFDKRYPGRELPRSACIGCPYHSNSEWRSLSPADFEEAVAFDREIRRANGMRGEQFLHEARVPLDQVDLGEERDHSQLNLWRHECMGVCGV